VTSAAGLETMEISGQASATAAESAAHILTAPLAIIFMAVLSR
jgi:hypothetical protein